MANDSASVDGLISMASRVPPKDTMNRVLAEVAARGLTVFARIDHAAGAEAVGLTLRSTELLIFGDARGGTPLMQDTQTIGIDLPLKVLVWQDADGRTWLSYNDPQWLARRHALPGGVDKAVHSLSGALNAIARAATSSPADPASGQVR